MYIITKVDRRNNQIIVKTEVTENLCCSTYAINIKVFNKVYFHVKRTDIR